MADDPGSPDDGPTTAESAGPATHEVTLRWRDGREETVGVRPEESVLEAAERTGVSLPFGCRTGACATCTGQLCDDALAVEATGRDEDARTVDDDAIEHARPPRALKQRHLDDGYVLPCIARPRTDCTLAVGPDVQTDLVENPWK